MRDDIQEGEIVTEIDANEVLHGVGLELMMMIEELRYGEVRIPVMVAEALADRMWLLTQCVGAVIIQHESKLKRLPVDLPKTVAAKKIRNPYYEGKSETPQPKAKGASSDDLGRFPF